MDKQKLIEQIAEWSKAVRDAEAVVRDNTEGRDKLILDALDTGVGATEIARASGLARSRIYQIRG